VRMSCLLLLLLLLLSRRRFLCCLVSADRLPQPTTDSWSQREPAKTSEPKILPRSLTNRHNSRTAPRLPAEYNYRALQPTSSHTDMPVRLGDLDSSWQTEAEAEPEAETPSLRNSNTRTSSTGLATWFSQGFGRPQCASGYSVTIFEGIGERMLVLHEPTDHTAGRTHHTKGLIALDHSARYVGPGTIDMHRHSQHSVQQHLPC
jgi:hypothetical protein